ncbi:RagB/SusD family nutrient uptake outer membrane protein [Belliella sp. DSM 111904]|uniref:RagB/SusD family nutrient uptake outer membrane protein n=1 Tax=Belliella filtrata TaxID=2923435 RepID=A0ABS9UXL9_9BACT|nr:RagB/SusD family nutrient uptake outer membrane protein [Belliella filtrata]MCH7408684.1 RagB/SusD family nutrient uptake outer membrane protein [Belliella filtrata]
MKKILYTIIILILAGSTGCDEEQFLKEDPRDNLYADNLFGTFQGFRLATNALLDFVRDEREDKIQSAELGFAWKIGVDNGWANTELSWTRGLNQYNIELNPEMQLLNGDTAGNPGIFLLMYRAINSANMIIARAENPAVDWEATSPEMELQNKQLILGHAHLIRAWAYRHLVYSFGDVPISTEEINGLNYKNDWERRPVREVQELIVEDLLLAEEYLPHVSNSVLNLSGAIASHYLAEMYLWMDMPEQARDKASTVVYGGDFSLTTSRFGVRANEPGVPFMDQFYDGNITRDQGNREALWIFPNSDVLNLPGASSNSMRRSWVINYNGYAPFTPENGGRGIGRLAISAWAFSIYEPQDDRFSEYAVRKFYIGFDGDTIRTHMEPSQMNINNNRWASTRKWDWTYNDPNLWNANYAFADQVYLRVAETYLLLAEAEFKLGNLGEAATLINQIRRRSNASEISPNQVTIDFILDERSRELVTEEHRRHTMVRTGKLVERNRAHNRFAASIQEFQVLLPIPQRVIDANTDRVMPQNQGY